MTIYPFKVPLFQSTNLAQKIAWNKSLSASKNHVNRKFGAIAHSNSPRQFLLLICLILWCATLTLTGLVPPAWALIPTNPGYEQRPIHNPDGIGKFYLNREIAQVMGHRGAGWLERPSREREEQPQTLIAAIALKPTDIVADIGAGTGYFSFRIAPLLPQGTVLAVDVQPEMIDILTQLSAENQVPNVQPILGDVADPHLPPSSVDVALMVDAYHEFEYPKEMIDGVVQALKPGGRVVLVEYRGEDPRVFTKPLHKMTQRQVRKEMTAAGLRWLATQTGLPQQHILIFGKP